MGLIEVIIIFIGGFLGLLAAYIFCNVFDI